MPRRFIYFPAPRATGGLKFLLRTGTNASNYQWFVGGDRPTPTPINTDGLSVGTNWLLTSIVATGPGPDEWVCCAVDSNATGGRVAFLDATGVLKIDAIAVPSPGGIATDSTGNFASRVSINTSTSETNTYWSSTTTTGGGDPLGDRAVSEGFYFLPGVVRNLEAGIVANNTKRQAVANAELAYSLRAPTNAVGQTLYRADGSRTTLTTPIVPDPAAGLTGNVETLQMFQQACSLVDLVLWRWTGIASGVTSQTVTQQATITADRWQLYDDATWDYLPRLPVTYQLNAGYTRIDMSGWIES